jgi:anthranilate phosphoribosyltransferase
LARVLGKLGTERAWVVHGSDGLDEMTTTGASHVAEIRNGEIRVFDVTPEEAGLKRANPATLKGADAATNAQALRGVLDGAPGAYRDIVLLNAAAALVVADKATDLKQGVALAAESIASGKARAALERLVAITNEAVPA